MSFAIDGISGLINNTAQQTALDNVNSLKNSAGSLSSESTKEELMEVCRDFTSYFVEEVLKEVKENMTSEDEEEDSSLKSLTDFHMDGTIELIADQITEQVGGSFTQQLFEQMKRNYNIE